MAHTVRHPGLAAGALPDPRRQFRGPPDRRTRRRLGQRTGPLRRLRSDDSVAVPYGGEPLRPSTRYHWSVTVRDAEGRRAGTATSAFETGLMSGDGVAGWDGAQWIGMKGKAPGSAGAPRLRKEEALKAGGPRRVRAARLYLSALGVYEAHGAT
ncbi:hypothetical protein RM704_16720 [Streptomyces sp. DSM 3412]|uniref:Uncharacterized protein n=1 Tax=Streptomyces gottesmaniae TaxID=3075518 RepID=A0ABU2YXP0_9ACTN|nr:hypothetical protein [Streptomyces sp. DSM 3412]MDT0569095.1 hypothetical protein [Streptomyces sp. DSM 3412]